MKLLFATNNPVDISYALALLQEAGLEPLVFDTHTSIIEGSIGAIPQRVMIADSMYDEARKILIDAQLLDANTQ